MKLQGLTLGACLLACLGCGKSAQDNPFAGVAPAVFNPATFNPQTANNVRQIGLTGDSANDRVENHGRSLIYRAEVDLLVEDLSGAGRGLESLLKSCHGIVASSEVSSSSGAPRVGVWRLRVPPNEFEGLVKAIAGLGEIERSQQEVQDASTSYSELEAQIKNMTSEVEGLRELAKKATNKLADTLAVREQLAKTTTTLEGLKARLERMKAEAEYSTILLRLRERKGYVSDVAPSFTTSISRAFSDSWQALVNCARTAAIVAVIIVPWLPVLFLAGLAGRLVLRLLTRRRVLAPTASA
jgi:hypothetical protein